MEWNKIKIPETCGRCCQFFNEGEDPVGFCSLYYQHWDFEYESEDYNSWVNGTEEISKPYFCKVSEVLYK